MARIELPEKVEIILNRLMENGYDAYAVGGCVRDTLMGRIPEDWDITTEAKPEEVKALFSHTVDTGIEHGTVTIMLDKEGFEVTTYRIDGEYEDSRHPKNVAFTRDLTEDLRRRDFTINAMAYNHKTGLVDLFEGEEDLKKMRIRCVGKAEERFGEDALRMLRAVRFAGQLGFGIEKETRRAIKKSAPQLQNISRERIRMELEKLLLSKGCALFLQASELGLLHDCMPEFEAMLLQKQNTPYHIYPVGIHAIKAVESMNEYAAALGEKALSRKLRSALCFTLLLHDVGKPSCYVRGKDGRDHFYGHAKAGAKIAKEILKRLKFDNFTIEMAERLITWHDYRFQEDPAKIRKAASKIGPDIMESLFLVQKMDILAKNPAYQKEKLEKWEAITRMYAEIKEAGQCLTIRELAVNGRDLIEETGVSPGPLLGEMLKKLLDYVLIHPEENKREILLQRIHKL